MAFLKLQMPNAYLKPLIGTCYGAWVIDVGDRAFCDFMLEQARRNIELLPDTDGICIDRLDWLRYYNPAGDDGVSWVDGRPARSLYRSWLAFTDRLGPLMHKADKVIFANTMTMRLELNRQLDGIYTEHGNTPGALNAAALMGIRKPVLAWTNNETLDQPDPDSFMQRHLHLGVFPTAPYPFNNHCINPDAKADRLYMDYGPLLDTLRGRKWVLTARCVEAADPTIKVNLFRTPAGYVLPVTFGGRAEVAPVRLRNIAGLDKLHAKALSSGRRCPPDGPGCFQGRRPGIAGSPETRLRHGCPRARVIADAPVPPCPRGFVNINGSWYNVYATRIRRACHDATMEKSRFYVGRVVGRDYDHRHSDCTIVAGSASGAGSRAQRAVRQQSQTACPGLFKS